MSETGWGHGGFFAAKSAGARPLRRGRLMGRMLAFCLSVLATAGFAMAAPIAGTVTNGTTNKPVSGAEVILLELESGMTPVAKTTTDAHGRFELGKAASHTELVQVNYRGVSYYQSVDPNAKSTDVVVYDTTTDPKALVVASHVIVFQPSGGNLQVEEQYMVENTIEPAATFYVPKGTFRFQIPAGAQLGDVSTWTGSRIPTLQKPIDAGNNVKAIDWAFRPGKNVVRVAYQVAYPSNQTVLHAQSPYPATHVFLAVPPGMQVSSDGFSPMGSEQGYTIYARQSVPSNADLAIAVSGVATAAGAPAAQNSSGASSDSGVRTIPDRYRRLTWLIAGLFGVLMAIGAMMLWRKSPKSTAGDGQTDKAADLVASAQRSAQNQLDEIKNRLLQLELKHAAGTLGDSEYARERQSVEKALRALLKA